MSVQGRTCKKVTTLKIGWYHTNPSTELTDKRCYGWSVGTSNYKGRRIICSKRKCSFSSSDSEGEQDDRRNRKRRKVRSSKMSSDEEEDFATVSNSEDESSTTGLVRSKVGEKETGVGESSAGKEVGGSSA